MPSSFRRDLPLMYAAYALRYFAPLILVPFYGRALGIQAYGQLLSAMALMQIAWLLIEWGLPATGFRDAASALSERRKVHLLGQQLAGRLALSALVVPLGLVAVLFVPALATNRTVSTLALALGMASAFNMGWYFSGLSRFRLVATIEVTGLAISTVMTLLLVKSAADTWIIPALLLIVGISSSALQLLLAAREVSWRRIRLRHPFKAIRVSTLLFVERGQIMMLGPLCVFVAGFVVTPTALATFAVADRLMAAALALLNPLNQIFAGRIAMSVKEMRGGGTTLQTKQLIRQACGLSLVLYFIIACGALVSAPYVIPIILGAGYEDVTSVFQVLCAALIILGCGSTLAGNILYSLSYDKEVAAISTVRLASTVIFVAVLCSIYGAMGAALGRVAGASAALVAVALMLRRRSLWSFVM